MRTHTIKTTTLKINLTQFKKRLFIVLSFFVVLFAVTYMFLIASSVGNIVERKNLENEVRSITSTIGELELEYLSITNTIDIKYAKTLGFVEPSSTYYASRATLVRNNEFIINEL
ncbi:hypothetical protein COB64_02910 [Candidatus Wolfebacteria bacterium]|nr:MAG: hypothetical protein COB64_02910 [Candidatus Wolfebacteria bacterium]